MNLEEKTYTVQELTDASTSEHFDYVLMSAGGGTDKPFPPLFEKAGAIVIDNSSQWRMTKIDLIVPEVNEPTFTRGIIANPNCSTIQSVVPLKVLQDAYGLKRVAYTTYQAVSGSGMKGKKDLAEGVNGKAPEASPHPIYNNVLPHIDVFLKWIYKRRTKND